MEKHCVDGLLAKAGLKPREVQASNHGLKIRVLKIGPAEAAALLAANTGNRKLREKRASFYGRVMQSGDWKLTHQGIAFSSEGLGVDLQHRLTAVVKTGVEIEIMVTEGLHPSAFDAIDQHERRAMHDALKMKRHLVEEAKFLLYMAGGGIGGKPTLAEVSEAASELEEYSDKLNDAYATKVKIVTAVPMRLAAMTLMKEFPSKTQEILHKYRTLGMMKSELYTPIMHAFDRQIRLNQLQTVDQNGRMDVLIRGLRVLDPKHANTTRIQVASDAVASVRERLKNTWDFS